MTESGTESGTQSTTDPSGTTMGPGTTPTGTDSDSEGGGPLTEPAKGGITIKWVQANQGIGVMIGEDGEGVPGSERTAFLPQNRITLVRAFWEIPEDWTPREIRAQLTIEYPDDTPDLVQNHTLLIEDGSFEGELNRSFFWGLMADQVVAGIDYKVELFETDPEFVDLPAGDVPPNAPYEGSTFVGIEDSYQVMRVVVVPFNLNAGTNANPDCRSDLSFIHDDVKEQFEAYMFMMNPIELLEVEWHAALDFNQEISSFAQTNAIMEDLRFEEVPNNPEVYYYGVVDPCSGGLGGAGGLANGIPSNPTKSNAFQRVSSGILSEADAVGDGGFGGVGTDFSADTFVHEVGHSQGRRHIDCGGAQGVDATYPHEGGDIGEWGFGVIDFGLKHPTVYKDYMTYCNPAWVSTFGWNKTYPIIQTLSAWDFEGAPAGDGEGLHARYGGTMLVGYLYPGPDGKADWLTVPGALAENEVSAAHHVELRKGDATLATIKVGAELLDDGTLMIKAPLPAEMTGDESLGGATEVVWFDDARATDRAFAAADVNALRKAWSVAETR